VSFIRHFEFGRNVSYEELTISPTVMWLYIWHFWLGYMKGM